MATLPAPADFLNGVSSAVSSIYDTAFASFDLVTSALPAFGICDQRFAVLCHIGEYKACAVQVPH